VKPDGTIGTLNGWHNIETQLKYGLYQNAEHEFIVSVAGSVEWATPAPALTIQISPRP